MSAPTAIEATDAIESLRRKVREYERWFKLLDGQNRVLERERQKLSAVLNHADAGFIALEPSLKAAWTNDVFKTRFLDSKHRDDIVGAACNELLCGKDEICDTCPASHALTSGEVAHCEISLLIGGYPRIIYATAMPIKSPYGDTEEALVMVQDVSDLGVLRRSQEALRQSEEKYRLLIESVKVVPWEMDAESWRFTYVGPQAVSQFGHPIEDWCKEKFWLDHLHPDDRDWAVRFRQAASARGENHEFEYRLLDAKGHTVWVRDFVSVVMGEHGPQKLRGVFIDITEHKTAEEALRSSEEQVRQAQKMEAIGTLASGVAHDFNNILTGIMGQAELIKIRSRDERTLHATGVIEKAAQRAAGLTQQLLGFSRRGKHQNVPVDIQAALRDVINLLTRTVDRNITIEQRTSRRGGFTLGDPAQILQVLLNLAVNARDAMPNGGKLTLATDVVMVGDADVRLRDVPPGEYVLISVTDTGSGIPEEIRDRIFEPFFTTKESDKGTGMGLAVVYGIVRNHGGAIQLTSEVGRGTRFDVYLPLCSKDLAAPEDESAGAPVRGRGRVLVVDDEECVREVAADFLRHLGYDVVTASDGLEAVRYYKEHPGTIDLILLDMVMPKMGGRECFHALREVAPSVRAVLTTGYGLTVAAQELFDEGMKGFIQKPYQLKTLSEVVAAALHK